LSDQALCSKVFTIAALRHREGAVAIYRIMQQRAFSPEDVSRLSEAYEAALKVLDLPSRADPVTETVAKRIIEAAERGITDPAKICAAALKELGIP
jgi:hypothetical protein